MSELVKAGGIGKNPTIDRIHKMNERNVWVCAISNIEKSILTGELSEREYGKYVPIDFAKAEWNK